MSTLASKHRTIIGVLLFLALIQLSGQLPASAQQPASQANLPSAVGGATHVFLPLALRGGVRTITHSQSQEIVARNSAACHLNFKHFNNAYLREFTLRDFGINSAFAVSEVEFGVEFTRAGSGGTQPVQVQIYRKIDPSGPLVYANLASLATTDAAVPDLTLTRFAVPITGTAPAGSVLVVEVFTPNGLAAGHTFYIGSNATDQTGPSYIAAADCAIAEPTDTATVGFPRMHIVMNVTGIPTLATGLDAGPSRAVVPVQVRLLSEPGRDRYRLSTHDGNR